MHILLYVGPAPHREQVLQYSKSVVQRAARMVTLLTCEDTHSAELLRDAQAFLAIPESVPVRTQTMGNNAIAAVTLAVQQGMYDLVIFGRLHKTLTRLLPITRSRDIAQRLAHSVLRVDGTLAPIRKLLFTSSGNTKTRNTARVAAQLAGPLGASVTVLHVLSQQSLFFEGFADSEIGVEQFLAGDTPEAHNLRSATEHLRARGVPTELKGRVGGIVDEVLSELQQGDYSLLVTGEHRASSVLDRILLEDMALTLLDASPLPVLVAKAG